MAHGDRKTDPAYEINRSNRRLDAIYAAREWQHAHAAKNTPTPARAYVVIEMLLGALLESK